MAVHLPLSAEAQAEARILMLSSNNILKPADGRRVALPSHEMIIGMYYLTTDVDGLPGEGRVFRSTAEAIMAFDLGEIDMRSKIKVRLRDIVPPAEAADRVRADGSLLLDTTLGKITFNNALPTDYPFVTAHVGKRLSAIVNQLAEQYPRTVVSEVLDEMKDMGFAGATVPVSRSRSVTCRLRPTRPGPCSAGGTENPAAGTHRFGASKVAGFREQNNAERRLPVR